MREEQQRGRAPPLRTILQNFVNHVENLEARRTQGDDCFEKEFQELKAFSESLKRSPQYTCQEGEKEVNRKKNRYKDILPFDHTRVVLSDYGGVPGSDYINASYIKGASGSSAYITCQGPLPHTVADFWRMVVECEVQVIVMACNEQESGKHKCENYWAEVEGEEKQFGRVTVKLVKARQVCPDFLVRTMQIRYSNDEGKTDERTVCQFHYSTWPDHGVPPLVRPLLDMVRLVRDCQASETLPVLVHCSAGCGRTGTICAIDFVWGLLRTGKLTPTFSLSSLVTDMRKQRVAMVQTKEQYVLVHRAVRELFQEQLKLINAHPYANVDPQGRPLLAKEDPLYQSLDSLRDEEKVDQKEKEGSEASGSDEGDPSHLCSQPSPLESHHPPPLSQLHPRPQLHPSIPLPHPPPSYTNVPLALQLRREEAPPLPQKKRKDPVTAAVTKLEKEVENLHEKQRAFHCQPVVSSSPSPLQSSSDSLELASNSGSLPKKKRLFNFSLGGGEKVVSDDASGKSHSEPSSSRASPIRSALLRKPSIIRLKAFFEKGTSVSRSDGFKKYTDAEEEEIPVTPPEVNPTCWDFVRHNQVQKSTPVAAQSTFYVANDVGKSQSPAKKVKPTLPIKRSKSVKIQWSGKSFQVVPSESPDDHRKTDQNPLPYLGLETHKTESPPRKPVVPPRKMFRDSPRNSPGENGVVQAIRQKSMDAREAVMVVKSEPENQSGKGKPSRRPSHHHYTNVKTIHGSHPFLSHSAEESSSKPDSKTLTRSRSCTWQLPTDCPPSIKVFPDAPTPKAPPSYAEATKPDAAKRNLAALYAKVVPRSKRLAESKAPPTRPSSLVVTPSEQAGRGIPAFPHDIANFPSRQMNNVSLGVRERRHSFRQAVCKDVDSIGGGSVRVRKPKDYEAIWPQDVAASVSASRNPPQVVDKACQTVPSDPVYANTAFCQTKREVETLLEELKLSPRRGHQQLQGGGDRRRDSHPGDRPRYSHTPPNASRSSGGSSGNPLHKYEVVVTEDSFSPRDGAGSSGTSPYVLPKMSEKISTAEVKGVTQSKSPGDTSGSVASKSRLSSEEPSAPVLRRTVAPFSSRDDLDLRPQAPPRIKRNSSVVVMRHSLIEGDPNSPSSSPGLCLSVWGLASGSVPGESSSPPSPPGVDLDQVAQSIIPHRMKVPPPPPPPQVPSSSRPHPQHKHPQHAHQHQNSQHQRILNNPPPTSPKPLVRALGMFQATAANIKSRFNLRPEGRERASPGSPHDPYLHGHRGAPVSPNMSRAQMQGHLPLNVQKGFAVEAAPKRDVVTTKRKQQYL